MTLIFDVLDYLYEYLMKKVHPLLKEFLLNMFMFSRNVLGAGRVL